MVGMKELLLYLLQLVQALKFESSSSEIRTTRSTSNHAVMNEDSGLADFLVGRGVRNPILGNRLHWYLMVELEDKLNAKTYGRVAYKFMTKIMEVNMAALKR